MNTRTFNFVVDLLYVGFAALFVAGLLFLRSERVPTLSTWGLLLAGLLFGALVAAGLKRLFAWRKKSG